MAHYENWIFLSFAVLKHFRDASAEFLDHFEFVFGCSQAILPNQISNGILNFR